MSCRFICKLVGKRVSRRPTTLRCQAFADTFLGNFGSKKRRKMGKQDRFTDEFKRCAVAQVVDRRYAVSDLANLLGVSTKSLYVWTVQFAKPANVRGAEADLATDLRRVKTELIRLKPSEFDSLCIAAHSPEQAQHASRRQLVSFRKHTDPFAERRMPNPQIRRNLTPCQTAGLHNANCIPPALAARLSLPYRSDA